MPSTIVGKPSAKYMICQPLRPNRPSRLINPVETGAPTATAIGRPTRKPDDARVVASREPVSEIEDEAGEESGFGHAEQEAHHAKAGRARDEGGSAGEDAPGDHDPRDPDPRADLL